MVIKRLIMCCLILLICIKKAITYQIKLRGATTTDESTMYCVKIGCFGLPRNFRVIWLFDKKRPRNRDFFSANLVRSYLLGIFFCVQICNFFVCTPRMHNSTPETCTICDICYCVFTSGRFGFTKADQTWWAINCLICSSHLGSDSLRERS